MTCWLCGFQTTKTRICKNGPCQMCTAAIKVDEEINQAVATLRSLLAKRSNILSEHNRVHGTLIHRLPVELKNRIFELLLPSRDEWGVIDGTGMQPFLATISVCRGWRDVALSNPFLWSTMHIELKTSDSCSGINDWILHSRTLPLTLHIEVADSLTEPELSGAFLPVLDALKHCSNRLQSLSLRVPLPILGDLQHDNFQYHRLTRLQITDARPYQFDSPLLLNPTASPEEIELCEVSFRSLQISWSRLISASFDRLDLEEITQLLQQASQMTFCQISELACGPDNFSMPPIIHHRLKTLDIHLSSDLHVAFDPLGSLTLPCLQEVVIYEAISLKQLPALVHRSSCPLTSLTLFLYSADLSLGNLRPLPGVTDLVIGACEDSDAMTRLLLERYFPDLRHLTLQLRPFKALWNIGIVPSLLDRKRPRLDDPNGGRLHKFIVVDQGRKPALSRMWNSEVGDGLKELNVTVREDGFEFF